MKLINAKGRVDGNSGYTRVMGDKALGSLLSKVQSTVISNGTELERIITSYANCVSNLDKFIDDVTNGEVVNGVYLCKKVVLKKSKHTIKNIEPDLLVFLVQKARVCKVIELKDGDAFDTKKSLGEKLNLEKFAMEFGSKIPFVTDYYVCSFNQTDKAKIYEGFKKCFTMDHILTGRELCQILKIDYEAIIEKRTKDCIDNLDYFIDELLKIPVVKNLIEAKLKQK